MSRSYPPHLRRHIRRVALWSAIAVILLFAGIYMQNFRPAAFVPQQPVAFSHNTHVCKLGMDCVACHVGAFISPKAGLPPASACMNCHQHVLADSPLIEPIRRAADPGFPGYTGMPVPWVMVNRLPGHAYFSHVAHVTRGVGCTDCHDDISRMDQVGASQNRGMKWCTDCHRNPSTRLRPIDEVANPFYTPAIYLQKHEVKGPDGSRLTDPALLSPLLQRRWLVQPSRDCTTCHH